MKTKEGQNKLATAIYNAFTKYKWEMTASAVR